MIPSVSGPRRIYVFSEATKSRYRKVGWIFIVIGLAAASFLAGTILISGHGRTPIFTLLLVVGIGGLPIIEGAVFLHAASRVSVVLSADSIEVRGLLASRTLRLADIAGKRKVLGRNGMITFLIPAPNRHLCRLLLPDDLCFDATFEKWIGSLPDLGGFEKENLHPAGKLDWREQHR
jgi:hypothetical protein